MALFDFGKRKATPPPPGYQPAVAAKALAELLERRLKDADGRVPVEDLLSAAAAVTGQACIAANGEFDPASHDFVPGSAVLSVRINRLICDDAPDWNGVKPAESVFGIIHSQAQRAGYAASEFPDLTDVIKLYVVRIGTSAWGAAPLSVGADHLPRRLPLQAGFELADEVGALYQAQRVPLADRASVCALAVVLILAHVQSAIDHAVALRIVLETINAMAKMAPMTKRHMSEALAEQARPAPPPG